MAGQGLKSQRFRSEREWDWRRLDGLLRKLEQRGAAGLSDDDLLALPILYRSTLSALSVARATSLDKALIEYLESLCARAYFFVYGPRSTLLDRLSRFFSTDLPGTVKGLWLETLITAAILILGIAAGWLLVAHDPDWYSAFVSHELSGGRDPSATTAFLREGLYDGPKPEESGLSVFATFLFTHNAQISLLAFALGFAFCLPTALLVMTNGCMMGAMLALYFKRGLGFEFTGWLMIHGVTELFAIILAGAAGLRIGWTVAFPGARSRQDALAEAGRNGAMVMGGVVVMLFVAGLLEGFGRQLITLDLARYAIAATTGAVWLAYFYLPRRKAGDGHR